MKKHIFLTGLLCTLLCTTNVVAQDAKEAKKAEKELRKLEKAEAKAEAKKEKRDKNQVKFDAFIENWEPVDVSGISAKMPNTIDLFSKSNVLFATMKEVYGYIDYIQIEALPENEEGIVEMRITNKNTGEDIAKTDALETYAKATLDLTGAALSAANIALLIPNALSEGISNPATAFTLGKKVKDTAFAVKYSIDAIPLIKAKIQDNIASVEQSKNN